LRTVLGEGVEAVKNVPMGVGGVIPLMHQSMYLLRKVLPRLFLEPLYDRSLDDNHLLYMKHLRVCFVITINIIYFTDLVNSIMEAGFNTSTVALRVV
jgi:hypothetical protein